MFKESFEAVPPAQERMTGDVAERTVLGVQHVGGYAEYLHGDSFEKRLDKVADDLIAAGVVDKMRAYYPEQTPEEWKLTVSEYARRAFLRTKETKSRLENEKDNRKTGGELSVDSMIAEKTKEVFSLNAAVKQVLDIASENKKRDPEGYAEGISTPFSVSLVRNLASTLKRRTSGELSVEYVPAILEDPNSLTYLDGMKAVDAFVVVSEQKTGFFRLEFIDFTTNPNKTDRKGIDKGEQVLSSAVMESTRGERKQTVYVDSARVRDDETLVRAGSDCAESMAADIVPAYEAHITRIQPAQAA